MSSSGGQLSVAVVLVLGFSNIFADALSMGVGEYLSSKVRISVVFHTFVGVSSSLSHR